MDLGSELRNLSSSYNRENKISEIVHREFDRIKKMIESQAPKMAREGISAFVLQDSWDSSDACSFIYLGNASRHDIEYAKKLFHQLIQQYAEINRISISYKDGLYKARYSLLGPPDISVHISSIRISW